MGLVQSDGTIDGQLVKLRDVKVEPQGIRLLVEDGMIRLKSDDPEPIINNIPTTSCALVNETVVVFESIFGNAWVELSDDVLTAALGPRAPCPV